MTIYTERLRLRLSSKEELLAMFEGHPEAAARLVQFAFADRRVRLVRAHTKPDGFASQRVLQKCGFRRIGDEIDPEDGPVIRWERDRELEGVGKVI